jgi:serine/threonine protein kinase
LIGKQILHFNIVEKIGEGGMGVVYKAEDTKLKRAVAIKFLPPELTRDPDAKQRFVREAQAASALDHPYIGTIHEINETDDGQLFIAMACYEGETLKQRIEHGPLKIRG